jgi:hypothetical protein
VYLSSDTGRYVVGEEWRDVVGYEKRYEVSDRGRLRTVRTGRVHKGALNADGYITVRLTLQPGKTQTHYLHRLVCLAFHGPPPTPEHVVNHVSGKKLDCRPRNLAWTTRAENTAHARALGLLVGPRGTRNANAKLTDEVVVTLRRRSVGGTTYAQLGRELGVAGATVYRAVCGHTWKHVA